MIDAYVWTTPNGFKALIALEELAIPYTRHWIDITKGEQKTPAYLAINPNNKIPAIVDRGVPGEPVTVFESGAVLAYLGDRTSQLMPTGRARYTVLEWLFFGAANPGPMIGQLGFWSHFSSDKYPPAIERYKTETERILGVVDRRLGEAPYLAGPDYTVADIMNFTWVRTAARFGVDPKGYANVARWLDAIEARPAVQRGLAMKPA